MLKILIPSKKRMHEDSTEDEHNKLFENIASSRKFNYSTKDMLWELFWLHKCKSSNKSWQKMNLKIKIFNEGVKTFNNEMDYANIIKSIRELRALTKSILDQDQQAISQFHQTQLIDPKDSAMHDLNRDLFSKIEIPNEKWSQSQIIEFEKQVNEILKKPENRWQISNQDVLMVQRLFYIKIFNQHISQYLNYF